MRIGDTIVAVDGQAVTSGDKYGWLMMNDWKELLVPREFQHPNFAGEPASGGLAPIFRKQ